jgi:hypothetical protein
MMVLLLIFYGLSVAGEADLVWSTFLGGGSDDSGYRIAVDNTCNIYVTGWTESSDFPTISGVFDTTHNSSADAFVAKLSSTGNALEYATFIGGSDIDRSDGIAVDSDGNTYISGHSNSSDFPTTGNAFDEILNGSSDAFVTKLNSLGDELLYSTFLGGGNSEFGQDITIDGARNAYIIGHTYSSNFPTTAEAFDTTYNGNFDIFVTKLNSIGSDLYYSTFIGGSAAEWGHGIAVDSIGNAYIAGQTNSVDFPSTIGTFDTTHNGGQDVFVVQLNSSGSNLNYATYLGGGGSDIGYDIILDNSLYAYITGETNSTDFPTTAAAFDSSYNAKSDAFIVKLNPMGNTLDYATFLGGSENDEAGGIAVDNSGSIYVTGRTNSLNFPVTPGAFDSTQNGSYDIFMAQLNDIGDNLVYATFMGGSDTEVGDWTYYHAGITIDKFNDVYMTGSTRSSDFPTTSGAYDMTFNGAVDVFIAKFFELRSPEVIITYPNGGETFADSIAITWQAIDPDPGETSLLLIDLDYSDDGGSTWSEIDSEQTNDGIYLWDISTLADGSGYLVSVMVTDTTGLSASDVSDAVFTIYNPDPPVVNLIFPNGGEILDSSATITWTATDPDSGETELLLVDLDYSNNGGASWVEIDSDQSNTGSYVWDLTEIPDGFNYTLRVTVTDNTALSDYDLSDSPFRIYHPDTPFVELLHPIGGESLGVSTEITWNATDPDIGETELLIVDLDYSPDGGSNWLVIDQDQENTGSYLWDLYGMEGGDNYLVRITVSDTVGLLDFDSSDSLFTIRDPAPNIHSIQDVPEDQGKQVAVLWDRSYLDDYQYQMITEYSIWRKYNGGKKVLESGREWTGGRLEDLDQLLYRVIESKSDKGRMHKSYWEYIGTVIANYLEGYSYIAPTLYDSLAGNPAYFSFIVTAHTEDPFLHWTSAPDSGCSVDNIAPDTTQVSLYATGSAKGSINTIWLVWNEVTQGEDGSPEHGPLRYNVYYDDSPDFEPSPSNLLVTTYDLCHSHTDMRIGDAVVNLFYLVTVLDGSDNESAESNRVGEFDRNLINGE